MRSEVAEQGCECGDGSHAHLDLPQPLSAGAIAHLDASAKISGTNAMAMVRVAMAMVSDAMRCDGDKMARPSETKPVISAQPRLESRQVLASLVSASKKAPEGLYNVCLIQYRYRCDHKLPVTLLAKVQNCWTPDLPDGSLLRSFIRHSSCSTHGRDSSWDSTKTNGETCVIHNAACLFSRSTPRD